MASKSDVRRYKSNLKSEMDGVALYDQIADAEKDEALASVYRRLARAEEHHVNFWRQKLRDAGEPIPEYRPSYRVRVLGWLARRLGVQAVLPAIQTIEMTAVDDYLGQEDAEKAGLHTEERSHARVFSEIAGGDEGGTAASRIAKIEGRHRTGGGNALRAAVLGANDGLVSNLSLVMGVAGADPGRDLVLLAGLSGVLAGSLSMALGEWISVQSSRELYERQIAIEAEELESVPEEEIEELVLIYESRGIDTAPARKMAERIVSNRATALETLVREELGFDPRQLGSPWVAGLASFLLFAGAAILPVIPFMVGGGTSAVIASAVVSALGLFVLGAAITLFTGRSVLYSGARQMAFGLVAAAITFGIGKLIDVGIGVG